MAWTARRLLTAAALTALTVASLGAGALAADHPWADRSLDPDARARLVLEAMTPEERLTLLHGPMPGLTAIKKRPADMRLGAGYIAGAPRLGVPSLNETDASLGVANLGNVRKDDVATALPSAIAQAAGWDADLVRRGGAMIGAEARAKGFNVMLAGGVNLIREARNGRNFEYFSEDPLLSGVLGGAAITGVQSNKIISTVKHYALNNQETGRNVLSVNIDEAAMRESDLLAFQIAIEQGRPGSVMCGYNRVNGDYACENDFLLNTVLKGDWGFKGWVMSDWGAVHSTQALVRGLDQQSGEQIDKKPFFGKLLPLAVQSGEIPQAAVDAAVLRILRTMFALGVVDEPVSPEPPTAAIDYDAHAKVAQEIAEAGMVLLRNEGALLPIAAKVKTIVVIGGHADVGVLSGSGSSQVRPVGGPALELPSPFPGPLSAVARQIYAKSSPVEELRQLRPDAVVTYLDGKDVDAARKAAKAADLAVVFGVRWAVEASDHPDLSLGDGQDALIAAVTKANRKTVVVLETDGPVAMPWVKDVGAIVQAWYPGQRGGAAIARILTGAVNPSGHLPVTFPADLIQTPNPVLPGTSLGVSGDGKDVVYGVDANAKPFDVVYPEGADMGYRWYDKKLIKPLFAFGHGLSYTRFSYGKLAVRGGGDLEVSFDVTNTGAIAGADVPQVYARGKGAKRLIGWGRVILQPGETRRVTVKADPRVLAAYDVKARRWALSGGSYQVEVGASALDAELKATTSLDAKTINP